MCHPSRHPSGTIYSWGGKGDWRNLPPLPEALLKWWQELLVIPDHVPTEARTDVNWDEVKSAVQCIPANCDHATWLEVLMGLHSTQHPEAYELARAWSQTCPEKYPGDRTFSNRWASFSTDKQTVVTVASVFHHAKEHGWIAPPIDVTSFSTRPRRA